MNKNLIEHRTQYKLKSQSIMIKHTWLAQRERWVKSGSWHTFPPPRVIQKLLSPALSTCAFIHVIWTFNILVLYFRHKEVGRCVHQTFLCIWFSEVCIFITLFHYVFPLFNLVFLSRFEHVCYTVKCYLFFPEDDMIRLWYTWFAVLVILLVTPKPLLIHKPF